MSDQPSRTDDQFLLSYNPTDLRIASEFLSNWLPFLSRGLCNRCTQTLSLRIRSLDPPPSPPGNGYDVEPLNRGEDLNVSTLDDNVEFNECDSVGNCDEHSLGSWKDNGDTSYMGDANLLGSWKEGYNGESVVEASTSQSVSSGAFMDSPRVKMSWADMAQEDELEAEEDSEMTRQLGDGNCTSKEVTTADKVSPKTELSREEREYIRFRNVTRKKDFICLERIKGKIVNILDGLELHTGVFSAAEQKRIVDLVYVLQEQGKKGELKERTYTAPLKWMRGKGRVTIQFGCCYNYATDKYGNPPGILQNEMVDPIPQLFKVIIRRLVRWHVLPPSCVPDSCIVNIYDEGDCIPPHIDNHDFVRPFCTVSFLSECNIVFGTNLKAVGPGEFSGCIAIPLPVGSVLVLNGNGADVAKHCVPAVPAKRISITFRRMDESKRPTGYVPEPDLQGLVPYVSDRSKRLNFSKQKHDVNRQAARRDDNAGKTRVGSAERGLEPHYSGQARQGPAHRRK